MNLEARLRSFATWPSDAVINPKQLAECGFFATGQLMEVECSWCHCRISDWEFVDNVEQRHRNLSPQCEFLLNRNHDGEELNLTIESNRLATFKNWPNPNISPMSLVKAGFYYLNHSDEVKCVWCKGVIAQWEKQDDAFDEHRRFFPDCPRVQLGPLIELGSEEIQNLGIQQVSPPKNPKFSSLDARLRTYINWPIPEIQKPNDLAEAGLYYQQVDDQVRCFHCNMGLRSWEKQDDPWFEHAKWYPQCQFVRLVKGSAYIQQVQETKHMPFASAHPINPKAAVAVMTMDEAMSTIPVRQALEMGVDVGVIRIKTQDRIMATGTAYDAVEDLLKAVFDDHEQHQHQHQHQQTLCETTTSTVAVSSSHNKLNKLKVDNHLSPTAQASTNNDNSSEAAESLLLKRLSLEEENRKLKDARLCKVCLDKEVGVVYLPCGHLVTCVQCAHSINQCPMCRSAIKGFVRTYL